MTYAFHKKVLKKPDGRALTLYSRQAISDQIVATSPITGPLQGDSKEPAPNPHLRWHPLRGEWVIYASHRQNRTFLPPKDYSPLAVTTSADFPTEMPPGEYDVAVFQNLFPSLTDRAHSPPNLMVPTLPASGQAEVVVFTQDPDASLGTLPLDHLQLVLQVLADRTEALGKLESVQYVLPFENRGVEMGVTLHHPHGQIYAYPVIPPVPEKTLRLMKEHFEKTGTSLLQSLVADELKDGKRILAESGGITAFVPICARYPYEVWIAPERPVSYLHDLSAAEMQELARVLKTVLLKYDGLWARPMPYLMTLFQAPVDGTPHPEAHLHFQICPPYRTRDRLKYLAGTELGGGMFVNDSIPEEKAAELQAVAIQPF